MSIYRLSWRRGGSILFLGLLFSALLSVIVLSPIWAFDRAPAPVTYLPPARAEVIDTAALDELPPTNCRYGTFAIQEDWLDVLGIGWLISFSVNFKSWVPDNIEYVPMLRLGQKRDPDTGHRIWDFKIKGPQLSDAPGQLGDLLSRFPGRLWMVGNEVDRIYWQDDIMPDVYAKAYHDIYHFIKQRDPTAQVAISGLVQVTPGRLQYLDIVWDTYRELYGSAIPVDVWNAHVYIFPEINADGTGSNAAVALGTDLDLAIKSSGRDAALCPLEDVYCIAEHDDIDIFEQQIRDMRQWMKDHGQQNKPLILSEFSLLYPYDNACTFKDEYGDCFSPERVTAFLVKAVQFLETTTDPDLGYGFDDYRLVQQWLWYAAYATNPTMPSNLIDDDNNGLSLMGYAFKSLVASDPLDNNLIIDRVSTPSVGTGTSGRATATVAVDIRNNGNSIIGDSYTMALYSDAGLTQLIDTVTVPAGLGGCARPVHVAEIDWPDLSPGLHRFWVRVDSTDQIVETTEQDNVKSGLIYVDGTRLFLPISIR